MPVNTRDEVDAQPEGDPPSARSGHTSRNLATWRRIVPVGGLFFLAPLVGEYLLGNVPFTRLPGLPFLALLYGGGALLVREVARRAGGGWRVILVLAAAYGVIEAGLIDQSLFNPPNLTEDRSGVPGAYIPAFGFGASNALAFVGGHVIWSIGIPIAITETFVPDRRITPWLGKAGLALFGALYLAGAVLIFRDQQQATRFLASPAQMIGTAAVDVALIGVAFVVARRRRRETTGRRAPRPLLVGLVAFVASGLFFVKGESWLGVAFGLSLAAAMTVHFAGWSRRKNWGASHRLGLAGGALLTYAWSGFLLTALLGRTGAVYYVGQAILAAGAVVLIVVASRTASKTKGPS